MEIVVFLVLAALAIFIIFRIKRRRIYELAAKIPKVSVEIPFFGITHKFIGAELKDYFPIIFKIVDKNEPIQRLWFGTQLTIIANTPEQYKTVLTSPHCLNKPAAIYDGFYCKNGLLSSNGEIQNRHRRILNNSMSLNRLTALNPIFNEKAKKFMMKMKRNFGREFNVLNDVAVCAFEALIKGNFLHDQDCSKSEVIEAFEK
jgi:cytochrome P450 family 4